MRLFLPNREVECRAVIFDKDGTLVDLESVDLSLARARAQALGELLGEEALSAWQQAVGVDLARGWMDRDGPICLAPRHEEVLITAGVLYRLGHPWEEARSLAFQAYDRADELQEPPYGAKILPGVNAMLAELAGRGLRLAIATTDRRWRAEAMMAALGAADHFCAMVGADDVSNGKPAPDMVHAACERLGCRPAEAVVVGDSPVDLEMARAGGAAAAIGVTTGLNGPERLAPVADVVLPSAAMLSRLFTTGDG